MRIQTLKSGKKFWKSAFGRLRTDDTVSRCFASKANPMRGPSYPMPIALALDCAPSDCTHTLIGLKLKHALFFLSWNLLFIYPDRPTFETSASDLQDIVGASTSQLKSAFSQLRTVRRRIVDYGSLQTTCHSSILADHSYARRRFTWTFPDTVGEWCWNAGSFGWIDLSVVKQLQSRSAIGLYEVGAALIARKRCSVNLSAEEFRTCLDVKGDAYTQQSDFAKRVISPATAEVEKAAPFDLAVTPASKRRDRHVDGYRVEVRRKSKWEPTGFAAAPLQENEWSASSF